MPITVSPRPLFLHTIYNDLFQLATANEEQKNIYKTMSSGELCKSDARKNSHGDGRCLFFDKQLRLKYFSFYSPPMKPILQNVLIVFQKSGFKMY